MIIEECLKELRQKNIIDVKVLKNKVICGSELFKLHDEKGFILANSLIECMKREMFVDWRGWIKAGEKSSWKTEKVLSTIIFACRETCYGGDYLRKTFNIKENHD